MTMTVFALVPLILVLVTCGGLVWLWVRVVRGRKLGDLPVCGQCGYGTRGLTGLACPECGADLREVGIVTPRARGQVGPAKFIGLWTLLLPVPMLVAVSLVLAFFAPHVTTWTTEESLRPESGSFDLLRIGAEATRATSGPASHVGSGGASAAVVGRR